MHSDIYITDGGLARCAQSAKDRAASSPYTKRSVGIWLF